MADDGTKKKTGFWDWFTGEHKDTSEQPTPTPTPIPDPDQDYVNEWSGGFGGASQRKGKK